PDLAGDHRDPVAHRLEEDHPEPLRIAPRIDDRGQHEHAGTGERAVQLRLGDPSWHFDSILQAQATYLRLESGPLESLPLPENQQSCWYPRRQSVHGVDQVADALTLDQVAHKQDDERVLGSQAAWGRRVGGG